MACFAYSGYYGLLLACVMASLSCAVAKACMAYTIGICSPVVQARVCSRWGAAYYGRQQLTIMNTLYMLNKG